MCYKEISPTEKELRTYTMGLRRATSFAYGNVSLSKGREIFCQSFIIMDDFPPSLPGINTIEFGLICLLPHFRMLHLNQNSAKYQSKTIFAAPDSTVESLMLSEVAAVFLKMIPYPAK